jgi:FkbH-like protein
VVVVVEWPDVDPRLGLRRLGGWRTSDLDEVVADAERQLVRLASEVSETAERTRVVCSLPTLPIPPVFAQGTYEAGAHELELRALVASLARELARHPSIRVAGAQRLAAESPPSTRHDPKSELATGFPYTREHASALARILARLVAAPPAKKGLITDLDDTLWNGIVGEIGTENVSWEEASGGHAHALYQQFLASLASAGVLIGAASKNDSAVVEDVFARDDILLDKEAVFPFEVHWNAKSESVGRILDAWNVAADSVVFVDDSPMEVAQVQSVFPEIEGFVFPGSDYRALGEFFVRLRDLFGKHATTDEDALRTMSIRSSVGFRTSAAAVTHSMEDFLREARGEITFSCGRERDARAFELINKTNQFNLNGKRLGENAFASALLLPGAFLLSAGYKDKYGPLGSIAAVLGQVASGVVTVHSWVMSCRAFSRRIEHHCLSFLFENFEATQLVLAYAPTERNRPLQEFLASIVGDDLSAGEVVVSREAFEQRSPALVHEVGGVRRG